VTGNGGAEQVDPLLELFLRMRRVLAPWGIRIDREHLDLWRDMAKHQQGPIRWAERGQTEAVEELVALLRTLSGIEGAADAASQDGRRTA
jgi:hypothetical protein